MNLESVTSLLYSSRDSDRNCENKYKLIICNYISNVFWDSTTCDLICWVESDIINQQGYLNGIFWLDLSKIAKLAA